MKNELAKQLINKLGLEKHIEGGYFRQTYQSADKVKPLNEKYDNEERSAGTLIYFLLEEENFSAWHVLKSDEIWHYYAGCPALIYIIDPAAKKLSTHILGNPVDDDASFHVVIKAGCYFAAEVKDKSSFILMGCSVNPGFEYKDFKLLDRSVLNYIFPEHTDIINKFTRITSSEQADAVSMPSFKG